jgi:hypothetical protein
VNIDEQDITLIAFEWTCVENTEEAAPCKFLDQTSVNPPAEPTISFDPLSFTEGYEMLWTMTISKDDRSEFKTGEIKIFEEGTSSINIVVLSGPIIENQSTLLKVEYELDDDQDLSYKWSTNSDLPDEAFSALTFRYLSIGANYLRELQDYEFSIEITTRDDLKLSASITITVEAAPSGGVFTINPTEGEGYSTEFTFSCTGYDLNGDPPTEYKFFYEIIGKSLRPKSLKNGLTSSFTETLPSGVEEENYEVEITAEIFGSNNAVRTEQLRVTVRPIEDEEEIEEMLDELLSEEEESTEAQTETLQQAAEMMSDLELEQEDATESRKIILESKTLPFKFQQFLTLFLEITEIQRQTLTEDLMRMGNADEEEYISSKKYDEEMIEILENIIPENSSELEAEESSLFFTIINQITDNQEKLYSGEQDTDEPVTPEAMQALGAILDQLLNVMEAETDPEDRKTQVQDLKKIGKIIIRGMLRDSNHGEKQQYNGQNFAGSAEKANLQDLKQKLISGLNSAEIQFGENGVFGEGDTEDEDEIFDIVVMELRNPGEEENSNIIQIEILSGAEAREIDELVDPVRLKILINRAREDDLQEGESVEYYCAYYDQDREVYSTIGVTSEVLEEGEQMICLVDHFTDFAVLSTILTEQEELQEEDEGIFLQDEDEPALVLFAEDQFSSLSNSSYIIQLILF